MTRPKQLHKHAVPVAMIMLAVLLLFALGASQPQATTAAGRSLLTRVIDVKPTPNGLAKFTVRDQASAVPGSNLSETGRVAQLSFAF